MTATPPVELGIEVDGFLMVLRVDENGPSAFAQPDQQPHTVFAAAADVVVGLAAGGITIDQALAVGNFEGDREMLWEVFAAKAG